MLTVLAGTEVPAFLAPSAALVVAAAAVGYLSVKARVVPIVGFLVAGVLIGPAQLGLVANSESVRAVAEIGVILLLFTIGIEFSLERLAKVWRWIVLGGGAQVTLAVGATVGLVAILGENWRIGLFTGFVVALSSTAIVLTILADRGQTNSVQGRLALSVLILQDLAVVAMVVVIPLLAADADGGVTPLLRALGTAVAVIAVVLIVARRLMPPVLGRVAALCSPEVFLLTIMAICLGTAYLTALAGVSVSLGAFLAGLVVSESRQSTQALAEILPLKILFSAVFFVSVGMLLDLSFVFANLPLVLALALGVLVLKALTTTLALLPTGVGWRQALAAALLLGQIGEFSFVLLTAGDDAGLSPAGLDDDGFLAVVAVTVLLMVLTPMLAAVGNRLVAAGPQPEHPEEDVSGAEGEWSDHVVILGWGSDSIELARELTSREIPVVMTTLNPEGVRAADAAGLAVVTGDPTRSSILEHVAVADARLVVIAEDEPERTAEIATIVRDLTPAPIVARAHSHEGLAIYATAGVDHLIDPQAASRYHLFITVLDRLGLPRHPPPPPGSRERTWADTSQLVHRPVPDDAGCSHAEHSVPVLPTTQACLACLRDGAEWVHLRVCLGCGHVGCCDSSVGRHARAHAAEAGHPVMGSAEPGEAWGHCYVDDVTFE
ncbi:cation:proton antiporter [Nocardioides sp.]|uniref:cation:proton antiporter domain-containing protein n=1 Tax=Nocardioides sp. TaxID=35761 RepID=UPI003564AE73